MLIQWQFWVAAGWAGILLALAEREWLVGLVLFPWALYAGYRAAQQLLYPVPQPVWWREVFAHVFPPTTYFAGGLGLMLLAGLPTLFAASAPIVYHPAIVLFNALEAHHHRLRFMLHLALASVVTFAPFYGIRAWGATLLDGQLL